MIALAEERDSLVWQLLARLVLYFSVLFLLYAAFSTIDKYLK